MPEQSMQTIPLYYVTMTIYDATSSKHKNNFWERQYRKFIRRSNIKKWVDTIADCRNRKISACFLFLSEGEKRILKEKNVL